MRLTDLEPQFLKAMPDGSSLFVETLVEADGIKFLCPKCFSEAEPKHGFHSVICWFTGKVPADKTPGPGRWNPSGTGYHDLTFVGPGAVSVHLSGGGCGWHGFIRNGEATLS